MASCEHDYYTFSGSCIMKKQIVKKAIDGVVFGMAMPIGVILIFSVFHFVGLVLISLGLK